ncbi:helix-turn-helix domain-containing protein [Paenibacillus campi]|uniref:TetR/AcrR family transcriptional regulator n=1 Tax=Paenibacillus campi TaxID=3106031 RepID=UPI002AFEC503|nr:MULTISPECIES: helix-turn-helix domain-containing protein [unclassified Paenibacillus]
MGDDRKKAVLKAGGQLFAEKGYFATTVQDIAEQCNMSKASIYKMFQSKEDILLQIIRTLHEEIVGSTRSLHFDDEVIPRDQLVQKLSVQLQSFVMKYDFFVNLNQNMPLELGSQIRQVMLDFKRMMLNWQKEELLLAYGSRIEPIIWDLSVCMQSISRELLVLTRLDQKLTLTEQHIQYIAEFIVDTIEGIIDKRLGRPPVIDEEAAERMKLYEPDANRRYFGESEWRKSVRELLQAVHKHSPESVRSDLLAAVERLDAERRKKAPQTFMMDALISYLKQREELQAEVAYLQQVYFANWEDEKHG